MLLSYGDGYLVDLPESHEGCVYPLAFPEGKWDVSGDTALEKGLISPEGRISWFSLSCGGKLGVLLKLQRGPQGATCVASGKSGLFSSCKRHVRIPLKSLPVNRAVSRVQLRDSVFVSGGDRDLGLFTKFS